MKERSTCMFGNDETDPEKLKFLKQELTSYVNDLTACNISTFYVGGVKGFDYLAAQSVLDFRRYDRSVKLILVLPCWVYRKKLPIEEVQIYDQLKRRADKVIYMAKGYKPGCIAHHYRFMIDQSNFCLNYVTQESGEVFDALKYAQKKDLIIRYVNKDERWQVKKPEFKLLK